MPPGPVVSPTDCRIPYSSLRSRSPRRNSVEPGSILPNGVEAFVARRRGVRVYRDPVDPDYAVIVVKVGNGADNTPDRGLLGVRANRVVWEIRREGGNNGLSPLMCRDEENRPGRVRQGCTGYGYLRP